jgi:hypothetical protein
MGYEIHDGGRFWTPKGSDDNGHYWQWDPHGNYNGGGGNYVCQYCGHVGQSFAGKCDRSELNKRLKDRGIDPV